MSYTNPRAFFWDIDGVFVDTEILHFRAFQKAFADYDATITREEYVQIIGASGQESVANFCGLKGMSADPAQVQHVRHNYLRSLRAAGVPIITENVTLAHACAVFVADAKHLAVSSALRKYLDENIALAGLSDFFHDSVSYEDRSDLKRKPEPDMYLWAMEIARVLPGECIVFEDSLTGITAAKRAGAFCVALPNQLTKYQDLSSADLVLPQGSPKDPTVIVDAFWKARTNP